jgi:predicted translin family RNA/ssDNA-binding protein
MNDIKGTVEAVTQLYQQLDEKLSQQGGLQNILSMHRRLREAVFAINSGELATFLNEIERVKQTLDTLKADLAGLQSLRDALKSATLHPV